MLAALLAAAAVSGGTVVSTAHNAQLKTDILVTASGMTLYEYESDSPKDPPFPYCVNDQTYHCSRHWIPLLTTGKPKAAGHAEQRLLGTVKRSDGGVQVTYKGHPLYTWKGGYGGIPDKKPGDDHGQGFAGLWYVLTPTGAIDRKLG